MIKAWQKPQQTLFLLAAEKQLVPVVDRYRVQEEMIETKNFVPGAFMIYHFQDINRTGLTCAGLLKVSEGDKRMLEMHVKFGDRSNPFDEEESFLFRSDRVHAKDEKKDGDEDDEEWDEEDEDEEDEEWDEDLDEDEEWDDEDEEWDDDEDEEWDDDEDVDEDEDWGDEEES
jgi:hypothetical protein